MPNWDAYIVHSKNNSPLDELAVLCLDGKKFAVTFNVIPSAEGVRHLNDELFEYGSRTKTFSLFWKKHVQYVISDMKENLVLAEESGNSSDENRMMVAIAKAGEYLVIGTAVLEYRMHCMAEVIIIQQHLS